jgi:FkbH-like protein/FkbM family methyltransferase
VAAIDVVQDRPVTTSTGRPRNAAAQFTVGVRAAPYLADHGFRDMVVLPGASYVDMAVRMERETTGRAPEIIRNVSFLNPIVLSADDVVIGVDVDEKGGGRIQYKFYEIGSNDRKTPPGARHYAATLEVEREGKELLEPCLDDVISVRSLQASADGRIEPDDFYRRLRENGNQYGPHFQKISALWRDGSQAIGEIRTTSLRSDDGHALDPRVLDSVTQLFAPFALENAKTFVLRSIEKIELRTAELPETVWAHAARQPADGEGDSGLVGNVRVFDSTGKPYLGLTGVSFALLDRDGSIAQLAATKLVVAANFTLEPLADSLRFWEDHFGVRISTEFAAYNQIFQQLLDPSSEFHANHDGVNAILIGLEEWTSGESVSIQLDREKAEQSFGTHPRYVLPNGLEIVHLNRYETDYVYKEIFEDQCYLRHDIQLRDGATVLDIGANIGLFSLFVMNRCAGATIFACEPAPLVYELLKANCEVYGSNVRPLNVGVSDKTKTATFTFYEKSSVFSGFHSDVTSDREAIRAVVRNMLKRTFAAGESIEEYVNELTADRLDGKTYECQLMSVSDIVRANGIDKIDLLKIDAEKSELAILDGIDEDDWSKIDQIVMEIHDPTRVAIKRVEDLLVAKGFRCAVEQEALLEHAGLFNLYAWRHERGGARRPGSDSATAATSDRGTRAAIQAGANLQRNVRDFCTGLRTFVRRSKAPVVLCICPRTPAAAADPELLAVLEAAEETLLAAAANLASVHAISPEAMRQRYPVTDYYDPDSHQIAHIPYTPACYAVIGTALVRAMYGLKRSPFKVIVLDCDNTLWKGVCGEDGPLGVEVSAPFQALQHFMIGQMRSGMLLCLCSKNNEQDVLDVFAQCSAMALKREHLVSWRINWSSKSDNIIALAKELNLGLDSFVFVDDNPIECADVRINCPDVLTLQLPADPESFSSFLNHVWAFDCLGTTNEDQKRTRMYAENARREQYREKSLSLRDYIKGLQLRIDISVPTADQLDRVSQLTFRTNQFNFTTIRRSKKELEELLQRDDIDCWAVSVVDRFGDYGLVGVLIYEIQVDRIKVDTLLMSCRILGRGVEHALVARLGRRALQEGRSLVEFSYVPTERNALARNFVSCIGEPHRDETTSSWTFSAERLASLQYDPDDRTGAEIPDSEPGAAGASNAGGGLAFDLANRSERLQKIGDELYDAVRISAAVEKFRRELQSSDGVADLAPGNALENSLLAIWRSVLGRSRIGLNENFFDIGGSSLRAVQVMAAIKRDLAHTLSIVTLFECPTIALLAAKLGGRSSDLEVRNTAAAAKTRGRQRRYGTTRRRGH